MNYCDLNLKCVDVKKSGDSYDYLKLLASCIKGIFPYIKY